LFYTQKAPFIKWEVIQRDENFYKTKMEGKLVKFYYDCLLPELADPLHNKTGCAIRDPQYMIDANEKQKII
jgi:hypothetical protein